MTMGYTLDFFVGQRFYLFNYATKELGGYVDFDWFSTEKSFTEEEFYSSEMLAAMAETPNGELHNPAELFLLNQESFEPSLYLKGTYKSINGSVGIYRSAKGGVGGWNYPLGIDVSAYNYLVVNLPRTATCHPVLRIYDQNTLWTAEPYEVEITSKSTVVDLHNMTTAGGKVIDPKHIYVVGISTDGTSDLYLKDVFLSMDGSTQAPLQPNSINGVRGDAEIDGYYSVSGVRLDGLLKGINIVKMSDGRVVKIYQK